MPKYGVISGPYFPVFGLNEIYFVNLRIQSKYRKIRTRNNSIFGHFSPSESYIRYYDGGNKNIFFANDDALGYLTGPMHKKYSITFIWGYPFSTCGSYERFFDPSHTHPLCGHMCAFRVSRPFAYVISLI